MIALILGWHLIAIGIVTAFLAIMVSSKSDMIVAAILFTIGLVLALKFRDTCVNYRSDKQRPNTSERELDYY